MKGGFGQVRFPTNMDHTFSQVPQAQLQRSTFKRPFTVKTTFDEGYIIPIYVDEALPGDTFNLRLSSLIRLSTPIYPLMDNLKADFFFFAVPKRLVWENFEAFQGATDDPYDPDVPPVEHLYPQMDILGEHVGSMTDYFGLPVDIPSPGVSSLYACSLWHRAYNLIYNTWFRDQNMVDSVHVDFDDGPDFASDYPLRRRGKRHDYFTSCLPWPQKGPTVALPLGEFAPVYVGGSTPWPDQVPLTVLEGIAGHIRHPLKSETSGLYRVYADSTTSNPTGYRSLYASLEQATAASVNSLREAFQLQRLLERDARSGTRYVESLKAHWGVTSPDFRLQNPEYIGGGSMDINITPVPQTSTTTGSSATGAKGSLAGVGVAMNHGEYIGFNKSFVEHSLVLGFVSIRADLTYWQGIPRMFSRRTRYDEYYPVLANLGEQAVLNKEIYAGFGTDDDVFGYQERWAEYRYGNSRITGKFRPNTPGGSLDAWHLSQEFGSLPVLGQTFVEENPPVSRVVAVTTEPHFIGDFFFDLQCARPMPLFSVPGFVDHF